MSVQKNPCVSNFLFAFLLGVTLFGSATADAGLSQRLDRLLERYKGVNIGVEVFALEQGRSVYQRNADSRLLPASNTKLFTGAAALLYLGKDFYFRTQLLSDHPRIEKGTLQGDLYIKFSGDPELNTSDVSELFRQLRALGVGTIAGDIVIDDSLFDTSHYAPGWDQRDYRYCYATPVTPITLNENCVNFFVTPNLRHGRLAGVSARDFPGLCVVNQVRTLSRRRGCHVHLAIDGPRYIFTGCIPFHGKTQVIPVALLQPRSYVYSLLRVLLSRHHFNCVGKIRFGKANSECMTLVSHYSEPLYPLVTTMMKDSNNLIANLLYRQLGHVYFQKQSTWEASALAVRDILSQHLGLNLPSSDLYDGSGGSLHDRTTAHEIINLLVAMYSKTPRAADYFHTLPVSGVDGTLKRRFRDRVTHGHVFAKTGTMTGVTSLSGYLKNRSQQMFAFSILINGRFRNSGGYKRLEEQICKIIVEG